MNDLSLLFTKKVTYCRAADLQTPGQSDSSEIRHPSAHLLTPSMGSGKTGRSRRFSQDRATVAAEGCITGQKVKLFPPSKLN